MKQPIFSTVDASQTTLVDATDAVTSATASTTLTDAASEGVFPLGETILFVGVIVVALLLLWWLWFGQNAAKHSKND